MCWYLWGRRDGHPTPATKSGFLGSHGGCDTALEPHQLGVQPCLPHSLALISGEPLTLSEPLPLSCQQSSVRN